MAEYVELYIDQGSDFDTTITLNDDTTELAQDLTGYLVTSNMRKSLISVNAYASFICSISNSSAGEITMAMPAANTANLKPGRYFFDLKLIDTVGGNTVNRLIEGVIIVTPSITK